MNIKLEKWYIDFTSKKAMGFYYIMCVSLGPFRFGLSGINHFDTMDSMKSCKFSRLNLRSFHALKMKNASFSTTLKSASLHINHGLSQIQGTWKFLAPPQKRIHKPLYKSGEGWCDWKVWTPKAKVEMVTKNNGNADRLEGTGYIDYVRFNLPPWKTPLRRLYWGRMHSEDSWAVFMSLNCSDKSISIYMDPKSVEQDVSVLLNKGQLRTLPRFIWTIGSEHNSFLFDGKIFRTLENEEILGKSRYLKLLPPFVRNKMNSSGCDEKFEIRTTFRGKEYHGIMEEVSWDV
jgi:hypothetical protein